MTDEPRAEGKEPETSATVAEQEPEAPAAQTGEEQPGKLHQQVEMQDIGPCKKHIKVTVDRADIDRLLDKKYSELVVDANVAGFRPGKAPRKIVERRYHKDVTEQIRAEVLLQSLEQLAEEQDIAPLTPPDINPAKIDIPKQGPLVYEFDVEVRPQFDLPNYKELKIKRVHHAFTDDEIAQEEHRILAPYGQLVPKPEGNAQIGDYLVADLTTRAGDRVIGTLKEVTIRIDPKLALKDGVADHFADQVKGANGGDTRVVAITLSDAAAEPNLRGQTVQSTFEIKEVKSLRLPELTHEFLHEFGVHSPEQLRERVRVLLERRHEYQQRQSARDQVMQQLAGKMNWELPQDLLVRQARGALSRKIMEMRSAGISEDEIRARQRLLQQDVLANTASSLKEHFVLQKIAEVEKLDVDEDDMNDEIDRIATQSDESPRRVRARLEKENLMDALATEIVERKALDLVLESAEYEDVTETGPAEQTSVATVEEQAVPGEMHDPTAVPPAASEEPAEAPK